MKSVYLRIFLRINNHQDKTGLSIDEYGDTRLIPQNLELLINLANDYIKTLDKQSMKIVIEFIKNLRPMIIDKNTIWVSGD